MMGLAITGEDHGVAMRDVLASFVMSFEVPPAKADFPQTRNIDRGPPTRGADLEVWSYLEVFESARKPTEGVRPPTPVLRSLVVPGATSVLKPVGQRGLEDRKSTRLNSSHVAIS